MLFSCFQSQLQSWPLSDSGPSHQCSLVFRVGKRLLIGFLPQSVQPCVNKCCCLVCFRLSDEGKQQETSCAMMTMCFSLPFNIPIIVKQILTMLRCGGQTGWCVFARGVGGKMFSERVSCHCVTSWSDTAAGHKATNLQQRPNVLMYLCSCCSVACHWEESNHLKKRFGDDPKLKSSRKQETPLLACFGFPQSIDSPTRRLLDLPAVLFLISLKAFADTRLCFGTSSSGGHLTFPPSCCRSSTSSTVHPVCTQLFKADVQRSKFML